MRFWIAFLRGLLFPAVFTLNQVEKFCHWFQRLTGLTNFWWVGKAALVVVFTALGGTMRACAGLNDPCWFTAKSGTGFWWGMFIGYILFGYGWDALYGWKRMEERAYERLQLGLANEMKILLLPWLLLVLPLFWVNLFMLAVTAYCYLRACDPLPPCRGKIREWWANRNSKLVPIPTHN